MPKKNSIGAVLLIIGLFLSGSLYLTLWMIKPSGLFVDFTIELHDTYLTLHPLFILVGVFSVSSNLFLIGLQLVKRFRYVNWNWGHIFCLTILGGFVFYGREVLRFGLAFIGRRMDIPGQEWALNDSITYSAGRWEKLGQKVPETLLVVTAILTLFLIVYTIMLNRNNKSLG